MAKTIDPTSLAFLVAESRTQPMHVGALHLFEKPEGAGADYASELYETVSNVEEMSPLFLKRPQRALRRGGLPVWVPDEQFDIEHHVRHSALPTPGRVRELLDLCSRLHSQRLGWERPMWNAHVIEGLHDDRVALYTKTHHSLIDGVSSVRLLRTVLSTDPDERGMTAPWALHPPAPPVVDGEVDDTGNLAHVPVRALQTALGVSAEAAGLPRALVETLNRGIRNETSAVSLHGPCTGCTTATRSPRWSARCGCSRSGASTCSSAVTPPPFVTCASRARPSCRPQARTPPRRRPSCSTGSARHPNASRWGRTFVRPHRAGSGPHSPTGRGSGLKIRSVWVRIPLGAPHRPARGSGCSRGRPPLSPHRPRRVVGGPRGRPVTEPSRAAGRIRGTCSPGGNTGHRPERR